MSLNGGEIDVVNRPGRLRCLQRHDLDSAGILDDVEFGDVDRLALANFDQAEVAQDPQCPLQVDGIVGYRDRCASLYRRPADAFFE